MQKDSCSVFNMLHWTTRFCLMSAIAPAARDSTSFVESRYLDAKFGWTLHVDAWLEWRQDLQDLGEAAALAPTLLPVGSE